MEQNKIWLHDGRFYDAVCADWESLYNNCPDNITPVDALCSGMSPVKVKYCGKTYPLVYHSVWDKCFLLQDFRYSGNNTSKLSAWLMDMHHPEKTCVAQCSKLCVVVEK